VSNFDAKINPMASKGFQAAADAYERGRPDYPSEAIQFLADTCGMRRGAKIIELGAGTGKFTRLLVPTQATLLAIEPVDAMRKKFSTLLPAVEILDGSAESVPAGDGTADVVVAAQAFHWFDAEKALAECHRVLRPGGMLGLIWNVRDESMEWVAELTRIIDVYERSAPRYKSFEWKRAIEGNKLFGPLGQRSFKHSHRGTVDTFMDRVASISFIASLPDGQRESVMKEVRSLIENHQLTKGKAEIETVYTTDVYWCKKA
jgi:ubiquinone/menaquinone biosynthesis C-methylase UbiE